MKGKPYHQKGDLGLYSIQPGTYWDLTHARPLIKSWNTLEKLLTRSSPHGASITTQRNRDCESQGRVLESRGWYQVLSARGEIRQKAHSRQKNS